jgi:GTPase
MIDHVQITVQAGNGGKGHVSFRRLKGKTYGPPEGGDGGDGGNVIIKCSSNQSTLLAFRYKKDFDAPDGQEGGKTLKKGARGKDLILEVPLGTLINDDSGATIVDLTNQGQTEIVALGGHGGRGNAHVKRSAAGGDRQKLRELIKKEQRGDEGEKIGLTLELKLLADVGLIGLPSAGKSTLISKLTSAKPKISPYHFTTLEPNLGVLYHKGKEIVLADIPGLIEGASKGKGLGDQFLRHVERTKVLVHLVSSESVDVLGDMSTINSELKEYSEDLENKSQVVVLSKIDTLIDKDIKDKTDQFKNKGIKVLPISATTGEGLDKLKDKIVEHSSNAI